MSAKRKVSSGSKARSLSGGFSNVEVISDGSGGSGDFARRNRPSPEWLLEQQSDRAMSEISSFHSVSVNEMQLSIDVTSGQEGHFACSKPSKSTISTTFTFLMLILGIILVATLDNKSRSSIKTNGVIAISHVIRAAGLFGFAGGVTNWIGIKLIFTRIPGLFCSGVLVKHFTHARETVTNFILEAFFSPSQVRHYVKDKTERLLEPQNFEQQLQNLLNSDVVARVINKKLDSLMTTPEGLVLRAVGVTKVKLKPLVKRYLSDMKSFASPMLLSSIQSSNLVNAETFREQAVDLIATRTQQMTAEQVKKFISDTLYHHLLWLVLWGNVFGALVGCVVEIASIYTRDLPW